MQHVQQVPLCRLSRGVTPAVIQSVAFSACSNLLAVSSARGTTHLFRLANPCAGSSADQQHVASLSTAGMSLVSNVV